MVLDSSRYKLITVGGHLGTSGQESSYISLRGQSLKGSVDARKYFPSIDARDNSWHIEPNAGTPRPHPDQYAYISLWVAPGDFSAAQDVGAVTFQVWMTFKVYFWEPKAIALSTDDV